MTVTRLESALRDAGIPCAVEANERLAVLVPDAHAADAPGADWAARRSEIVAIAREHGFTHVALELRDDAPGAQLHRDQH